jgi:UDP-3-O-[3-hydroxymyristoyl] N-acetylglucosamine deacetylase
MSAPAGWSCREGTLARPLTLSGHGLHTGRRVNVRILPAGTDSPRGIVFRRMQGDGVLAELAVSPALRRGQPLCTMLESAEGVRVRTVEHLLASLLTCEIDRATVELDAEEVPILDGSAQPWIEAIRACGRTELAHAKRFIRVLRAMKIAYGEGTRDERRISIEPSSAYEMAVRNDLKGFGALHWDGPVTPARFAEEIAPSRSYGRVKWAVPAILAGYLRGMPILRGARLSCTAAIVGNRVLGGMRVPDEFVRHRVLDLVGDMAMAGAPLLGRVTALRPSHEMNYRLVAELLATHDAWEWTEFSA